MTALWSRLRHWLARYRPIATARPRRRPHVPLMGTLVPHRRRQD